MGSPLWRRKPRYRYVIYRSYLFRMSLCHYSSTIGIDEILVKLIVETFHRICARTHTRLITETTHIAL